MKPANEQKNPDEKFPGYPHYPASEDITAPGNNTGAVSLDKDDTTLAEGNAEPTDNDITEEDLNALKQEDRDVAASTLDNTDEDGTPLNENIDADTPGNTLDVPGVELDDANEAIGEEDEENNYYSLGDDDTTDNT